MSSDLQGRIEALAAQSSDALDTNNATRAFLELIDALNAGNLRAATRSDDGSWHAQRWVKQGILLGFRLGHLHTFSEEPLPFFDKHTYPLKPLTLEDNVRVVPGGSSVRTGTYLAPGVVCMPPMYVNVGA
jgi:2,3,4,5-tetrahydropyridine-2-carboxylate N-succinyltransferase